MKAAVTIRRVVEQEMTFEVEGDIEYLAILAQGLARDADWSDVPGQQKYVTGELIPLPK